MKHLCNRTFHSLVAGGTPPRSYPNNQPSPAASNRQDVRDADVLRTEKGEELQRIGSVHVTGSRERNTAC